MPRYTCLSGLRHIKSHTLITKCILPRYPNYLDIWLETFKSQRPTKSHTLITKCILPRYPNYLDIWLETFKSQRPTKSHTLITKCILPRYLIILISDWRHSSPRDIQSLLHSSQSVSCHEILLSWYLAGDITSPGDIQSHTLLTKCILPRYPIILISGWRHKQSQRHTTSHTLITKCILPRYPIILISGWRHQKSQRHTKSHTLITKCILPID